MSAWAVTMGAGATMGSCIRRLPFHPEDGIGPKSITLTTAMAKHNSRALIPPGLYPWGSGWVEMNMILKDRAMGSVMHLASEREGYRSDTPAENPINWPRNCVVVGD